MHTGMHTGKQSCFFFPAGMEEKKEISLKVGMALKIAHIVLAFIFSSCWDGEQPSLLQAEKCNASEDEMSG